MIQFAAPPVTSCIRNREVSGSPFSKCKMRLSWRHSHDRRMLRQRHSHWCGMLPLPLRAAVMLVTERLQCCGELPCVLHCAASTKRRHHQAGSRQLGHNALPLCQPICRLVACKRQCAAIWRARRHLTSGWMCLLGCKQSSLSATICSIAEQASLQDCRQLTCDAEPANMKRQLQRIHCWEAVADRQHPQPWHRGCGFPCGRCSRQSLVKGARRRSRRPRGVKRGHEEVAGAGALRSRCRFVSALRRWTSLQPGRHFNLPGN